MNNNNMNNNSNDINDINDKDKDITLNTYLTVWKDINIQSIQSGFDQQILQIDDWTTKSLTGRKKLRELNKDLKQSSNVEKLTKLPSVIKAYTSEIDVLTSRAKYSENAFLSIYKVLHDAPDPSDYFIYTKQLEDKIKNVNSELLKVRSELNEKDQKLHDLENEFETLKNQDVTVRRLEEEKVELMANMQIRAEEMTELVRQELQEELRQVKERMNENESLLRDQLKSARDSLAEAQRKHEHTKNQLFELQGRLERKDHADESASAMLLEDLERSHNLVRQLQNEKMELQSRLENSQNDNNQTNLESLTAAQDGLVATLEEEINDLKSVVAFTESQIQKKEDVWALTEHKYQKNLKDSHLKINELNSQLTSLQREIKLRPSVDDYNKLKMHVRTLQELGFNVLKEELVDSNEIVLKEVEEILLQRCKKLQSELTDVKTKYQRNNIQIKNLEHDLNESKALVQSQQNLVNKLEEELSNVNITPNEHNIENNNHNHINTSPIAQQLLDSPNNNHNNNNKQTSGVSSSSTPSSKDHLMFVAVCRQRDRYRQKAEQLEQEKREALDVNSRLTLDLKSLRQENLKLYEKLQYVQNYKSNSNENKVYMDEHDKLDRRNNTNSSESIERKYQKLYAEKVNPFKEFKRRQDNRNYDRLPLAEKITLNLGRFCLSRKPFRSFIFFYGIVLHILIFAALWTHTINPHC